MSLFLLLFALWLQPEPRMIQDPLPETPTTTTTVIGGENVEWVPM